MKTLLRVLFNNLQVPLLAIHVWTIFLWFGCYILLSLILIPSAAHALASPKPVSGTTASSSNYIDNNNNNINIQAAVLVPGFLTGADEFKPLCQALTDKGLPTVAVPMPNYHWLPCLGGRSSRPILERINFTVQHLLANNGDIHKIPSYQYSIKDLFIDMWTNPGGVGKVGGSAIVDEYPTDIKPQGDFPLPDPSLLEGKKIALIGHSAGGWISRIYLSDREYGGKAYKGHQHVHSLVTLGTPHVSASGVPFESIIWCSKEPIHPTVRALAVGGTGFKGNEWGSLTEAAYAFCCPDGSNGTSYDGDGLTPSFSATGMDGAETMLIDGVGHFAWSDVFGGSLVAPELSDDHRRNGRAWYGSDHIIDQWVKWILDH